MKLRFDNRASGFKGVSETRKQTARIDKLCRIDECLEAYCTD